MYGSPLAAYDRGAKTSESNRSLEAAALFKTARALEACQKNWSAPDRTQKLDEALRMNQQLWTLFQSELIRPDQSLAVEVRHNLLRISGFVDKRTFELMTDPSPEAVQALIDINRHIASGLSIDPAAPVS